jgi:hypothetical protein
MASRHDKLTVASIAIIATTVTVMLHEGVGHGVTSWLRGDIPTELTSNHLSDMIPDKVVAAGGTIVNLIVGTLAYFAHKRAQNSTWRWALWLFAAFNLMEGTGYFMFSGVFGIGDWQAVIDGIPGYWVVRVLMALVGVVSYTWVMSILARSVRDYAPDRFALWTLPYLAAGAVQCAAGVFDPGGLQLYLMSTIPGTLGGTSGLIWGAKFLGDNIPGPRDRVVGRVPAVWLLALAVAAWHIGVDGPGIKLFAVHAGG